MRFLFRLSQTKYNICKSLIFGGDFFFQIFTPVPCSSPSLCPNHWAQYYTQTDRHWAGDLIFQSQPLFLHHHTFLQIPIRRRNGIFSFVSHSQNLVKFFVCLIISFHRTKKNTRKLPLLFVLKQMKTNEEALLFSTMKTLEEHSRGLKPEIGATLNFLKSSIHLER